MLKSKKWFFTLLFLLNINFLDGFCETVGENLELTPDETANYKIYDFHEKIHPRYDNFKFTTSYQWEENKGFQGGNPAFVEIHDNQGELIQRIDLNWVSVQEPKFHIVDFNFDGYKDILLLVANTGTRRTFIYQGWLWNSKEKQFEEYEDYLPGNLAIDPKNKQILSVEMSPTERCFSIFRFQGKKLVPVAHLEIDYQGREHTQVTMGEGKKQIVLGKYIEGQFSKEIKSEIELASNEGKRYKEIQKRYYAPKSFWRLNDPRWYQSDYGKSLELIR